MKRPEIPYNRPCTNGELVQIIKYYLNPDDKKPLLFEDDIIFLIMADKFDEDKNGTVYYQKICFLKKNVEIPAIIPAIYEPNSTKEEIDKIYTVINGMVESSKLGNLLKFIETFDKNEPFTTGFGNDNFTQYMKILLDNKLFSNENLLTIACLPNRPGSKGLNESCDIGYKFKIHEDGSLGPAEEIKPGEFDLSR